MPSFYCFLVFLVAFQVTSGFINDLKQEFEFSSFDAEDQQIMRLLIQDRVRLLFSTVGEKIVTPHITVHITVEVCQTPLLEIVENTGLNQSFRIKSCQHEKICENHWFALIKGYVGKYMNFTYDAIVQCATSFTPFDKDRQNKTILFDTPETTTAILHDSTIHESNILLRALAILIGIVLIVVVFLMIILWHLRRIRQRAFEGRVTMNQDERIEMQDFENSPDYYTADESIYVTPSPTTRS